MDGWRRRERRWDWKDSVGIRMFGIAVSIRSLDSVGCRYSVAGEVLNVATCAGFLPGLFLLHSKLEMTPAR